MKTVGFVKTDKKNEKRIAVLPVDLMSIENKHNVYIETGYGAQHNISDDDYLNAGVNIATREEILSKDIIVDPKIGDATYIYDLKDKIIFGWIHAVQNKKLTDSLIQNRNTVYAWEDINHLNRHVFWRNNEIAGEASILHALTLHGKIPYGNKAAILGNGNTARGALKALSNLGVEVNVYTRKMEESFVKEIGEYDIVVNAILWDIYRKGHILYTEDLKRMKSGSIIIDISCDNNGAIQSSKPTTFAEPMYTEYGIEHYAVENTPSLFYKTASEAISKVCAKYIDYLILEENCPELEDALILKEGIVKDNKIIVYQGRQ